MEEHMITLTALIDDLVKTIIQIHRLTHNVTEGRVQLLNGQAREDCLRLLKTRLRLTEYRIQHVDRTW